MGGITTMNNFEYRTYGRRLLRRTDTVYYLSEMSQKSLSNYQDSLYSVFKDITGQSRNPYLVYLYNKPVTQWLNAAELNQFFEGVKI